MKFQPQHVRILGRMTLHLLFLFMAGFVGMIGVFVIGVPAVGDNPGAVAGGILPFFGAYFGLIFLEVLILGRAWGKRFSRIFLELCVTEAVSAAAFALWTAIFLGWSIAFEPTAASLITSAVVFLLAEATLTWLAEKAKLAKIR